MPLGAGGMAEVWVAGVRTGLGLEKLVALKRVLPVYAGDTTIRAMFLKEAKLAARLHHANVVEVLDLGEDQGIAYQVMPLVEGGSLTTLLRRSAATGARGLPPPIAARIAGDVLRGLAFAHAAKDDDTAPLGVVHRDVSPQNVLVGLDGVAKLADFGIAKAMGPGSAVGEESVLKGKLRYIAPEQIDGEPATVQSDLYSVGAVLWELLSGAPLHASPSDRWVGRGVVPDLRALRPELPSALLDVVLRAIARRPDERFASATSMLEALEQAARPAAQQEVAALVDGLLGDEVRELRRRARNILQGTDQDQTDLDLNAPAIGASPPPTRRLARAAWIAAALLVLGTLAAFVATRPSSRPVEAAVDVPPPLTAAPPASVAPPVTIAPPPTATLAVAAPRASAADEPKRRAPPPRATKPARPAASPSTRAPTFDNPY